MKSLQRVVSLASVLVVLAVTVSLAGPRVSGFDYETAVGSNGLCNATGRTLRNCNPTGFGTCLAQVYRCDFDIFGDYHCQDGAGLPDCNGGGPFKPCALENNDTLEEQPCES